MPKTLLRLDSSPLGEASISRHLTAEFVHYWKLANPGGKIIVRDTTTSDIPPVTAAFVAAMFTPEPALTTDQLQLLALSDTLISELLTADEYVFGVPMHNFSIPSTLKLWIDQIVRGNKTFSFATGTPVGMLTGKKATVQIASGSNFDPGTALAPFNYVEPYLRSVFAFLGVHDVTFLTAGGARALHLGADRDTFLAPHIESIRAQFQAA